MKDYSQSLEENRKFILNFYISNDQTKIYINVADGKTEVIDYTHENVLKLLSIMKQQVIDNENNISLIKESIKYQNKKNKKNSIILLSIALISNFFVGLNLAILIWILVLFTISFKLSVAAEEEMKLEDLEKNLEYLKYETEINSNKNNVNVLSKLNEKTKRKLENKVIFTINDTEKLSFDELNEIINAIHATNENDKTVELKKKSN